MAAKLTSGLSYFSKLRVLARVAHYDDLKKVKKEAVGDDALNDQEHTLASLRQGIKARTTASMKGRERMISRDIENRIAIFMLVVAEESGEICLMTSTTGQKTPVTSHSYPVGRREIAVTSTLL